jgi:hypothetical protein
LEAVTALAVMSHPFGIDSWEKGVAVDCGKEWTREAIDLAVRGPLNGPVRTTQSTYGLEVSGRRRFTEIMCWTTQDGLPANFKVSPKVAVIPRQAAGAIILDPIIPSPPATSQQDAKRRKMGGVVTAHL